MKQFISFLAITSVFAMSLSSCSSSDDNEDGDDVSTIALSARSTYTLLGSTSTDEQPCVFYVFPRGNYISIKHEGTVTGTALVRVNAYAFRSQNDSVAAIGVGLYTGDKAAQPVPANGSTDTFWKGNYTIVALPFDYAGIAMHFYSCCMLTDISKPKNSSVVFLQPKFNKNDLRDKYNESSPNLSIVPWAQ